MEDKLGPGSEPRRNRVLSSLVLVGLAIIVVLAATAVYRMVSGSGSSASPSVGQPAPDVLLSTLESAEVRLSDLRGQMVLLNFHTTGCPYCRDELPILQEADEAVPGLQVVSVYIHETVANVAAYTEDLSASYRILVDTEGEGVRAYNVRAVPVSYFIDAEGVIFAFHLGPLTMEYVGRYVGTRS